MPTTIPDWSLDAVVERTDLRPSAGAATCRAAYAQRGAYLRAPAILLRSLADQTDKDRHLRAGPTTP